MTISMKKDNCILTWDFDSLTCKGEGTEWKFKNVDEVKADISDAIDGKWELVKGEKNK